MRAPRIDGTASERFDAKVDRSAGPDGCWPWTAYRISTGYGVLGRVNGRNSTSLAHRFAYERANGRIADGMNVLHRCDNPACCNPSHLFLGTQLDNVRDMIEKGRARRGVYRGPRPHKWAVCCKNGHPYPESLRLDKNGQRHGCKVCNIEQLRARRDILSPSKSTAERLVETHVAQAIASRAVADLVYQRERR